jgi:hypothetical protein
MSEKPAASPLRLIVGILIGAAVGLIAIAVWQIANDEGAPVFVAVAGAMLAALAAVLAGQIKKTPGGR